MRAIAWIAAVAFAASALTMAASPVQAQGAGMAEHPVTVTVEGPPLVVTPGAGRGVIHVLVTIGCDGAEAHTTTHQLHYELREEQPWAGAMPDSPGTNFRFSPGRCEPGETLKERLEVSVGVGNTAPAFETAYFLLTVKVDGLPAAQERLEAKVGFLGRWGASFERSVLDVGSGDAFTEPVHIENGGNGALRVRFALAEGSNPDLVLRLPGEQDVPAPRNGHDGRLSVQIAARHPDEAGRHILALVLSATSLEDDTYALDDIRISMQVQTGSLLSELPGPTFGFFLLAALAMTGRRRPPPRGVGGPSVHRRDSLSSTRIL